MNEVITPEIVPSEPASNVSRNGISRASTLYNSFQDWLNSLGGVTPSTIASHRKSLEKFELFMAGKRLGKDSWREYQLHLQDRLNRGELSEAIIRKDLSRQRRALSWLSNRGVITGHWVHQNYLKFPVRKLGKRQVGAIEFFTSSQYERLKECANVRSFHWPKHYQMIVMCYATGAPYLDICRLRWSSVDLQGQLLRLTRTVFGHVQEYSIPISTDSDMHKLLLEQWAARMPEDGRDHYAFPELARFSKQRFEANHIWAAMRAVFVRAGIPPSMNMKNFQHTFLRDMLASGVDFFTVFKMSGYADPKHLMKYCKSDISTLHKGADQRMNFVRNGTLQLPEHATS